MSDYVTLMGAEDVARAGRAMDAAAERMQGAAATFEAAVDRLVRALDEHTVRIEQALAKDKSEMTTNPSETAGALLPCDDEIRWALDTYRAFTNRNCDNTFDAMREVLVQFLADRAANASEASAAPPSDRAAVERVSLDQHADEIMKDASEHERGIIADLSAIMHDPSWHDPHRRKGFWTTMIACAARSAILRYRKLWLEAERARTSDTNAAAAPVGQAVDLVFDDFPGPQGPRFIEAEDSNGKSICVGEWLRREDGYVVLRMNASSPPTPRAAYRQPTIEDGNRMWKAYLAARGDCEESMLAALNSINAVIAEEVPK